MAAPDLCSIPGCGKKARRRGLCSAHYSRLLRHGDPLLGGSPRTREFVPCAVDGCNKRAVAYGYCGAHSRRFKRHGDPMGGGTRWGEPMEWLIAHVGHEDKINCLKWPFATDQNGYAILRYKDKNDRAHRLMCRLAHGEPPFPTAEAAHNCGRGHEGCINPHHLRWDTRAGNFSDKLIHGTHNRGDRCPVAKLKEDEVRVIKKLLRTPMPIKEIARQYQVAPATIYSIKRKQSWAWMD